MDRDLLTTYMMLGSMLREQQHPKEPELRLSAALGWHVIGGQFEEPLKLDVKDAYIASNCNQEVLDATRKLCGELRFPAKKNPELRKMLESLRDGLAKARELKARHQT